MPYSILAYILLAAYVALNSVKLTPTLPPIEASTIEARVVGICIYGIPLSQVDATNPTKSPVTPPPKLIIRLFLSTSNLDSHLCAHVLFFRK